MKYLCIFLFVVVFTNKVSAQEILYLKLDTTSQNQSMGSEWLLSPITQKYYNGVAYYHELYNGILIRMNCDDKDLLSNSFKSCKKKLAQVSKTCPNWLKSCKKSKTIASIAKRYL